MLALALKAVLLNAVPVRLTVTEPPGGVAGEPSSFTATVPVTNPTLTCKVIGLGTTAAVAAGSAVTEPLPEE